MFSLLIRALSANVATGVNGSVAAKSGKLVWRLSTVWRSYAQSGYSKTV
jgi:hypothetical protein